MEILKISWNLLNICTTQRPGKRLAIFGDGATYYNSQEFREYLMTINQDLSEEEWLINCTKFAPKAPEQNPVEDIWLQTKNFSITFYHLCSYFKVVKWLFKFFADGQIFNFPKLFQDGILPQPTRGLLYIIFWILTYLTPNPRLWYEDQEQLQLNLK